MSKIKRANDCMEKLKIILETALYGEVDALKENQTLLTREGALLAELAAQRKVINILENRVITLEKKLRNQ